MRTILILAFLGASAFGQITISGSVATAKDTEIAKEPSLNVGPSVYDSLLKPKAGEAIIVASGSLTAIRTPSQADIARQHNFWPATKAEMEELITALAPFIQSGPQVMVVDAVYRSPAEELRHRAYLLDQEEAAKVRARAVLEKWKERSGLLR